MLSTRDWRADRGAWIKILKKKTGIGLVEWNRRIRAHRFRHEGQLREWLLRHHVDGYAQQLLVMERFGYPDFMLSTARRLVSEQYADRKQLRPILDAIVDAAATCGRVVIQARKTYVSLLSPRRTFARIQPTTKDRVDLGLRLDGQGPGGRLRSNPHETMRLRISLAAPTDVDSELVLWLRRAYGDNA